MLTTFEPQVLASALDQSVNFVWSLSATEAVEARYVRREDDYFIVYLSSQTGCNQACRFCHLTATKQVQMSQVNYMDFLNQAVTVLRHYDSMVEEGKQPRAKTVHFNWMARGEPLLNPTMLHRHEQLFRSLRSQAKHRGLDVKFKISTIFPEETPLRQYSLACLLKQPDLKLYYSLYSLDSVFRKRWIPKAHDAVDALKFLSRLQRMSRAPVDIALHWAFIAGENDSVESVEHIIDLVEHLKLRAKFNLVRYNPYSEAQGQESSEEVLMDRFQMLSAVMDPGQTTRIVPRVGKDVAASCGMFMKTHHE